MSIFARATPSEELRLPSEVAFLAADGFPLPLLKKAAEAACLCGSDAATALIHSGLISEEQFYRALARHLGTDFLETIPLAEETRFPHVLQVGAAPLARPSRRPFVAAPRGAAIPRLIERAESAETMPAITTPNRLRQAAFAEFGPAIATAASDDLASHSPEYSCRPGARPADLFLLGALVALVLVVASLPNGFGLTILAVLQFAVLATLSIRIGALFVPAATEVAEAGRWLRDDQLPTYTVIVALYRESRVVPRLIHGLAKLDYPHAKLQVIFAVEADDGETASALHASPMPGRFEIVVAPVGMPKTKPRALNVALTLARGDLLVVYDAEDIVDPGQLRRAAGVFARSSSTVAGVQGRLVIDNQRDGLLTRFFAIEYSALFDVLGPALASWRMPTPLGGTTTHFRTRVLRELRGWDAWNVTEDADLGMRLALSGYSVGDLPSPTFEEAPKKAKAWLHQRTRWMKGFMQTSFTHARRPLETFRRLGLADSLCALTLLPGTVISALLYPFLTLSTVYGLAFGTPDDAYGLLSHFTYSGSMIVFVGGLAAMLLPGLVGCLRRRWFNLLWCVPLMPLYYLLVSFAAWLAVFELARHPHRWNKTEHGLATTSRSGALKLRRAAGVRAASRAGPPAAVAAA